MREPLLPMQSRQLVAGMRIPHGLESTGKISHDYNSLHASFRNPFLGTANPPSQSIGGSPPGNDRVASVETGAGVEQMHGPAATS